MTAVIVNKDKILQVAYDHFSRSGYSGTSIKMIADELDISTSLIFHHFKSKEQLWVSVERLVLQDKSMEETSIREDSLEHFVEDIVCYRLGLYSDKKFRRFFHWRALEVNAHNFSKVSGMTESIAPSPFVLHNLVSKLQKKQLIRQDLNAQVIAAMVFGCTSYAIWDYADYYTLSKTHIQTYKSFIIEQLMSALA